MLKLSNDFLRQCLFLSLLILNSEVLNILQALISRQVFLLLLHHISSYTLQLSPPCNSIPSLVLAPLPKDPQVTLISRFLCLSVVFFKALTFSNNHLEDGLTVSELPFKILFFMHFYPKIILEGLVCLKETKVMDAR